MVIELKRERTLMVILIITCAAMWQISTAYAADYVPVLRFSADDVYVTAGQENQIKITLTNVGTWNIYEAKISLSVPSTTPGVAIVENGHVVYSIIEDGKSKSFYPVIYVDESTPLGAYSLTLTAVYMKKVQYGTSMLESTSLQIGIVVARARDIMLNPSVEDASLTSGVKNSVNITLENIGDQPVYEIDAAITSTSPYIVVTEGGRFTSDSIEEDQSVSHPFTLRISRNAPLGVYTLTETVTYEDADGQSYTESFSLGFYINDSKPDPLLDLVIDNPRLTGGVENAVSVHMENIGDEGVYYIDVTLSSASPHIAVLEGSRFTQDGLAPGDGLYFESVLAVSRNIPIGVYSLTASVSYRDSEGQEYLEAFNIGVSVGSLEVLNQTAMIMRRYDTSIDTVKPGDEFDLTLGLESLGANAYDVKASLSLDPMTGVSIMSPTTVSLGEMEPGRVEDAVFELLVGGEVMAGQYPAMVTVSYLGSDGVPRSLVETVTLSIRGLVEFRLINEDQVKVGRGETTEFEADLLLVGTESIQFVSVEVVEDSVFKYVRDSEEYIGAVDPDSPIPFDLMFKAADDAELGDHTITLRITYTDDLNQEHEATLELRAEVTEPTADFNASQGSTGGFWVWLRRLLGLGP
ncbi:hypothetical protein E3J39_02445 [Candidatus Bathyarchaeota archaeon]|nr:MAG: hypothetical protein E3J39_02445 [Candidatus Bathyarchaeota archaeon]